MVDITAVLRLIQAIFRGLLSDETSFEIRLEFADEFVRPAIDCCSFNQVEIFYYVNTPETDILLNRETFIFL